MISISYLNEQFPWLQEDELKGSYCSHVLVQVLKDWALGLKVAVVILKILRGSMDIWSICIIHSQKRCIHINAWFQLKINDFLHQTKGITLPTSPNTLPNLRTQPNLSYIIPITS